MGGYKFETLQCYVGHKRTARRPRSIPYSITANPDQDFTEPEQLPPHPPNQDSRNFLTAECEEK